MGQPVLGPTARHQLMMGTLRLIGESVCIDQVNREFFILHQGGIRRDKFIKIYQREFGHAPSREQFVATETNELDEPESVVAAHKNEQPREPFGIDAADRLRVFVRLACVVEECGGLAKARQYLDIMERLGDIQ